jgi:peroxiredoxin
MTIFLASLILISLWVGFYQLVKQQGRILLRLDALERAAQFSGHNPVAQHEHAVVETLPEGDVFPDFELTDLSGKNRKLSDFRGRRVLLIHWNFECGFCEALAGDLARLEADLQKRNTQIVLLASGDQSFNRDQAASHGIQSPILLLGENQIPKPFEHQGTPVAYFLDEQAQVSEPFSSGIDEVLALARRIAAGTPDAAPAGSLPKNQRPLAESHIERSGLKAGTPAPRFRLPDLQGQPVSLDDYRSRRVLLVFSDPHCAPCDELAPHLTRLHRKHRNNGLAVILVGRGNEEENRNKATQFGFEFPVVLQDRWKLSKEYGIFATPVAFLIGENGVIAKDVAVGKDAILDLAATAAKELGDSHEFAHR